MHFKRFSIIAAILLGLALVAGCGLDQSPVAQDETALEPNEGRTLLEFAPAGTQRAAKPLLPPDGTVTLQLPVGTVTELIDPEGGELAIEELNGPGPMDDLRVYFTVPENGVDEPVEITMTLYGSSLSEGLVAEFFPGGLVFSQESQLLFKLGSDMVDVPLSELRSWHIHDDGTAESATILSIEEQAQGHTLILLEVPGFSQYCLGDDTDPWGCGF